MDKLIYGLIACMFALITKQAVVTNTYYVPSRTSVTTRVDSDGVAHTSTNYDPEEFHIQGIADGCPWDLRVDRLTQAQYSAGTKCWVSIKVGGYTGAWYVYEIRKPHEVKEE